MKWTKTTFGFVPSRLLLALLLGSRVDSFQPPHPDVLSLSRLAHAKQTFSWKINKFHVQHSPSFQSSSLLFSSKLESDVTTTTTTNLGNQDDKHTASSNLSPASLGLLPIPVVVAVSLMSMSVFPAPAEAAVAATSSTMLTAASGTMVQSALVAYGHYFASLAIVACLVAEKFLVEANMSAEDEETVVKIDLVYGLLAVLLIGSGFARATQLAYGKGGDFYIHETLFWAKMTFSGIWGGLSFFPSLTFYQRKSQRKEQLAAGDGVLMPISEALAGRLQKIINAEISAILTIPLLATLMSRGVGYWADFPWQIGVVISLAATGGSFYYYGKQALEWSEPGDVEQR